MDYMLLTTRAFRRTLLFWMIFALVQGFMLGAASDELLHLAGWVH